MLERKNRREIVHKISSLTNALWFMKGEEVDSLFNHLMDVLRNQGYYFTKELEEIYNVSSKLVDEFAND